MQDSLRVLFTAAGGRRLQPTIKTVFEPFPANRLQPIINIFRSESERDAGSVLLPVLVDQQFDGIVPAQKKMHTPACYLRMHVCMDECARGCESTQDIPEEKLHPLVVAFKPGPREERLHHHTCRRALHVR